jgi:hypothetical protein
MWHSHTEKELTNFDVFPGGMMTMLIIEPPGVPIQAPAPAPKPTPSSGPVPEAGELDDRPVSR